MPGRCAQRASYSINYRPSSAATAGIWCMVRGTIFAARKPLHGDEFSGIRAADRGAGSKDRGTQIPNLRPERQHRRGGQTPAIEEPCVDHQHLLEPLALANHAIGASSAAALHA